MQKPFSLFSLQKRIWAVILAISFLFCGLIIRLFVVQIINGKSLQTKALSQWTRDISIIAPRGKILDRTGSTLAVSYTTYNVYVRAREVKDLSTTAHIISNILELKFDDVYKKISKKGISEVLIKMQVDSESAEKIYAENLPGVYLAENSNRYYPYGDLLTQVLGFTSVDNTGQSGVESYYNSLLAGKNGYTFTQSDLQGKEIGGKLRYYVPAQKGSDITLTIDSKIELMLEEVLNKIMQEQLPKAVTGIVLNAKTSQILAMSSKPSFDLNNIPRDNIEELFNLSKIKAITDVYEPGSTFKILTLAAALEEKVVDLDDRFYCSGSAVVDGVKIKCWKSIGHGSQNLIEGFANSCNCVFMDLALRLGVDKFYSYLQKFGVGQKTGVSMMGEASGIMMPKSSVKRVDLARIGFGHAVAVTPLQLLTIASGVFNGGKFTTPTLLQDAQKPSSRQILSEKTSQTMNFLMQKATNKAGDYTFVEGYNVGGKTGTAQKYDESGAIAQGKYISSFIGSYPANDPDLTLIIMVDEASAGAYYGSIVAAPYGKELFQKIFDYLGIKKENENVEIKYVEMPNVCGLSLIKATETLIKLGINYEIDGEGFNIVKQLPPEHTTLAVGDTVVLITD